MSKFESAQSEPVQQELELPQEQPTSVQIVRIEKNLNSLGFFSPLQKTSTKSKTVVVSRQLPGGVRKEARATIFPSPDHGLPTTADLDRYLVFQQILMELKQKAGKVENPIRFTTYALLKAQGLKVNGRSYKDVEMWLERMTLTGIKSEDVVYFAGRRTFASAVFHVFEKTLRTGSQMSTGEIADQNYVWLSEWQLENLNHNYVLPVTLNKYRLLKSTIAKALVPMLHIWFYSTEKPVQKRYRDLCQHLGIKNWPRLAKIKEKLSPALNELQSHGYLESWSLDKTADDADYKLILAPGTEFTATPRARKALPSATINSDPEFNRLLEKLKERSVEDGRARKVLFNAREGQDVQEQIDYYDQLKQSQPDKNFKPGFLIWLIERDICPDPEFRQTRKRTQHDPIPVDNPRRELEERYCRYRDNQVSMYLKKLTPDRRETVQRLARKEVQKAYPRFDLMPAHTQDALMTQTAKRLVEDEVPMMNYEEFAIAAPSQMDLAGD